MGKGIRRDKAQKKCERKPIVHQRGYFQFQTHLLLGQRKGFTLDGAKQKLKENLKGVVNNHEIISRLESVKAELIKIKPIVNKNVSYKRLSKPHLV